MTTPITRRKRVLMKLGKVCAEIEGVLAGQNATLADLPPAKPGETELERLQRFKALLQEALGQLDRGEARRCAKCARELPDAELDEMPLGHHLPVVRVSDARLRELERQWRVTGAIEDRAAWLAERLRAGELEPARAEVAAWVGDEAARRASRIVEEPPRVLEEVMRGLHRWGRIPGDKAPGRLLEPGWQDQLLARAVLAVAVRVQSDSTPTKLWRDATAAVRDWLLDPGEATVSAAASFVRTIPRGDARDSLAMLALHQCGHVWGNRLAAILYLRTITGLGLYEAKQAVDDPPGMMPHIAVGARRLADEGSLLLALRDAIAPWVLGEREPLDPA